MCRNPQYSSLNIRSLSMLLHQYYRVSNVRLNGPSINSTTSFPRTFVTTAKFGTPYYMNQTGLRLFCDNTKSNNAHVPENEAKKVVVRGQVTDSKFNFFTWAKWIIGSLLTMVLPYWKGKWEGIQKIEGKVEEVVEEVEEVAEVVEAVAVAAENAAEMVADKLPENSILKEAAEVLQHASTHVVEDAHNITTFIHKLEDVKKDFEDLETMIEPVVDKIIEDQSEGNNLKN